MKSLLQTAVDYLQEPAVVVFLLDTALKSLLVTAFAAGLCACWRRSSAAARHWLWFLAIASLLCLPWWSLVLPASPVPVWEVSADLESGNRVIVAIGLAPGKPSKNLISRTPSSVAGTAIRANAAAGTMPRLATQLSTAWFRLLAFSWFGGMALVLVNAAVSHLRLRRVHRGARPIQSGDWPELLQEISSKLRIHRSVRLMQSTECTVPMTFGWLRPIVLLPTESEGWTAERKRIVLEHELAHVKRRDWLTQMIAQVICAFYWINPFVWLAARQMRIEREHACDDLVLRGGFKASAYATHLVQIARAQRNRGQSAALAMARPSGLEQRIRVILDDTQRRDGIASLTVGLVALGVVGFGMFLGGCTTMKPNTSAWSLEKSPIADHLKVFVAEKEAQATAGAKAEGSELLPEYQSIFAAAAKDDWLTISNIWDDLRARAPQYEGSAPRDARLHGTPWQTVLEIWGAFENLAVGGKPLIALGEATVNSIPPGGIYFGGTDPGRFVITALEKSQVHGDPFYTVTQNALADNTYLKYLRGMYGEQIYIPTDEDLQRCFTEYVMDAQRRLAENKLKPGEEVKIVDGRTQVSGQVAVMGINASVAKIIFDKNSDREFYVEESFPLDWMYPHLTPNGPIMKVNREPVAELSPLILQRDHEFWVKSLQPMMGTWLGYSTPVKRVVAFAERSPKAPEQDQHVYSDAARKWGSKLRSSIAGLYVWRISHANSSAEKQRMIKEADFAFRQAFALCPYSPEAVFRYVNFLVEQQRFDDAAQIAGTARKLAPGDPQFRDLSDEAERKKSSSQKVR